MVKSKKLWQPLKFLDLPSKKFQSRTYVLKKTTKYALMTKQIQMFLRNYFAII